MSRGAGLLAAGAAAGWVALVARWFDVCRPWRPQALAAVPPAALGLILLGLAGAWWVQTGARRPALDAGWLLVALALAFRLPLLWWGSAGFLTADGALSGLVSLRARHGLEHLVFVPGVPYSGSLKSHLAAPLAALIDPSRAFALASVAFYLAFVRGLWRLAGEERWVAGAAGLYAAFSPAFLTRYGLSNDGNYVEVLALGTWALVGAARWHEEGGPGPGRAAGVGVLLGLAFWCHILAVIHVAAVAVFLLLFGRRRGLLAGPWVLAGFALGYAPGLAWNAVHGWESLRYVVPGLQAVGTLAEGPDLATRAWRIAAGQLPVLFGYDPGHAAAADALLMGLAACALGVAALSVLHAARGWMLARSPRRGLLLLFLAMNGVVALLALPLVEGNPRYLLFSMSAVPIFMAQALDAWGRRWAAVLLVAFGAAVSLAQAPGAFRADERWRGFVQALEREAVGHCYTDFFLATRINFLSQERVACSAELGPTRTEYFPDFPERVGRASEAALVAVNANHADKLERRLRRLGVAFERRDLMKPVLLRLGRKVRPQEIDAAVEGGYPPPDEASSSSTAR